MALDAFVWIVWLTTLSFALFTAVRREPKRWHVALGTCLPVFIVVSLICTGGGIGLIDEPFRSYQTLSMQPLVLVLAPCLGLLAALLVSRLRTNKSSGVHRWLPAAMTALAALWLFDDVRATVFWHWIVKPPVLEAALASTDTAAMEQAGFGADMAHAYVSTWPEGPQAERARQLEEALRWRSVADSSLDETRVEYGGRPTARFYRTTNYLRAFPSGPHAADVLARITEHDQPDLEQLIVGGRDPVVSAAVEELVYSRLAALGTVKTHERYRALYPDAKLAAQSEAAVAALRADTAIWQRIAASGDYRAALQFLEDFPGHTSSAEAQRQVDGLPLDELVASNLVEFDFNGCGINQVCGRIRRLSDAHVMVRVPAGSLFTPNSSSDQSMVTTSVYRIALEGTDWVDVRIDAACASMWLDIPGGDSSLRFEAQDSRLQQLEAVLDSPDLGYSVLQALVWIVRDNPTRAQLLNHLVGGGIDDAAIDEAFARLESAGYSTRERRARAR